MNDVKLKLFLGNILRNKEIIISLISKLKAEDIELGKINLPASIINEDMHELILKQAEPYLKEYRVAFDNSQIILAGSIDAKQLGEIALMYRLFVKEFEFTKERHYIRFIYEEEAEGKGNAMQSVALKAAELGGSYLKMALDMAKIDFIEIDGHEIGIDLDKSKYGSKIPKELNLDYIGSDNDILKLEFMWNGN